MKKTRLIALILAALLACTIFTGCEKAAQTKPEEKNEEGNEVVKTEIAEEIYTSAIAQANTMFEQSYGFSMVEYLDTELSEGETGADILKEQALGLIKEFESVRLMAQENGVELETGDREEIKSGKDQQIETAGGYEAFVESLVSVGVTEGYYDYVMESQQIYTKVYNELFKDGGKFAPEQEDIESYVADYARVKHVLIQAAEGDEDYEQKKATAESIAARAAAGEDFEALITEVAESGDGDPGMESNADGYIIDSEGYTMDSSSQMITEFTEASHELEVGAVSGVVPSSYGFHIIKRYPMDSEYIEANYETLKEAYAIAEFSEQAAKALEKIEITNLDKLEAIDVRSLFADAEDEAGAADGAGIEESAGAGTEDGGIETGVAVAE